MDIVAVVGLGNPGPEYVATRHNAGFQVADALARRWRLSRWQRRYRAEVVRRASGRRVWVVKPQTFMNASGESIALLCQGEVLDPCQCLVVLDDVELPLGQLRLRAGGGAGTHNGLRSVVAEVGDTFPRLRLGVRGAHAWDDLADYVLAPFDADEHEVTAAMVSRAADCVETALRLGLERAANLFNQTVQPEEPA